MTQELPEGTVTVLYTDVVGDGVEKWNGTVAGASVWHAERRKARLGPLAEVLNGPCCLVDCLGKLPFKETTKPRS